jgi:hypothetical protein
MGLGIPLLIAAGINLTFLALLILVIPIVDDPRVFICSRPGMVVHPLRPKTTLWVKWNWEGRIP